MTKREKLENKAEGMVGQSFMYGVHVVQVLRWEINDERERFYLWTTRKAEPYDRPLDAAMAFLDSEFREVNNTTALSVSGPQPLQLVPPEAPVQMLGQHDLARKLCETLMDNIRKIQTDSTYIPQAEAIRENVDSIIDLAKTEVAYKAVMKRRDQNSNEDPF